MDNHKKKVRHLKERNDTKEIAQIVSTTTGFSLNDVRKTISLAFDVIAFNIANANSVHIRGLGLFSIKKRKKTRKFDFTKNAIVEIPPTFVVKFRPATKVKKELKKIK